jgi:hypothetical protein
MTTFNDSPAILLPAQPTQHRHDHGGAARGAPVTRPAPGSPLHGDDLAAAPFEVSTYAYGQLSRAKGLLDSWLPGIAAVAERPEAEIDEPPDVDPQIWAATLQDALVAAATAVWVLSPEERRVRVLHRLDLALREFLELGRLQRFAGLPTRGADDDVRRVIDVARGQGLRVTGCLPIRALLQAAAGHSTARSRLPAVYALLDAAANGDSEAVESLSRIPVRLPRSSSADTFEPSPSMGFRVALAAITSVVLYGESLYDAGRKAPR